MASVGIAPTSLSTLVGASGREQGDLVGGNACEMYLLEGVLGGRAGFEYSGDCFHEKPPYVWTNPLVVGLRVAYDVAYDVAKQVEAVLIHARRGGGSYIESSGIF